MLESIVLGGIRQWVLLRGQRAHAPVLLFLHGGPGVPLFPFAREIGVTAGLEQHCTVAYWEQRGTGKSFSSSIAVSSMRLDQFLSDTLELSAWLCRRFKTQRIYLLGHSWGSILGTLAAAQAPELFHAYIGVGQVAHVARGETASYEWVVEQARQDHHARALQELKALGPAPHDHRGMLLERKWVAHFGGAWHHARRGDLPRLVRQILRTPEYTWADRLRMARDPFFSLRHLIREKYTVDLLSQVPALQVPVYFLEGRHDFTVPSMIAREYFDVLQAPQGKHWIWFEQSAHLPHLEEPHAFGAAIAGIIQ